ncbi:hypothetical protein BOTBODRAFT_50374 [Botryobasidium botryosum FD-172 SS1]|uniref:BAG domain-containing protein n=1 Tax=Botryobasidium botryosum (strain FD-172 SS1) TaxID=930990 RepID=A0A067NCM7_BOTB1|nr:hypothetical protein BOTBODRAFT_50374 [Botryobasidium botryosum FD-172 SS1]
MTSFLLLPRLTTRLLALPFRRPHAHPMAFVCKWGTERYHLPLPPPDTPLSVLRGILSQHTHLPPHSFQLIFAGAIMKNDSASIASYGIVPGCSIHIYQPASQRAAASAPAARTPQSTLQSLQSELDNVHSTLSAPIGEFMSSLPPHNPAPPPRAQLAQTHTRLGEMLLQSLLRLDAIVPEPAWDDVRLARKNAVKEVQGLLDRLDASWHDAQAVLPA